MPQVTRKKIDELCPVCHQNLEEVTTIYINPFPEDNTDWTLVTHECARCHSRKKIYCDNPDLVGIEKPSIKEFKDRIRRMYPNS